MPHRVPGGNFVGRLIGLGNLDKEERERNMRRAHRLYERPYGDIEHRTRGLYNDRRDQISIPQSRSSYLYPYTPNGLPPSWHQRRQQIEADGPHYPGMSGRGASRHHSLPHDVEEWTDEQAETYAVFHKKDLESFRRHHLEGPDRHQFRECGLKAWVRMHRDLLRVLQREWHHRDMENMRGHGAFGRSRSGRRPRGHDFEDEDDYDDY